MTSTIAAPPTIKAVQRGALVAGSAAGVLASLPWM